MLRPWSRLRIGIGRARGGDLRDARARRVVLPVRRVRGRAGRRALFQTVLVHLCDATRQGEAGLTSGRGGTPGSSTGLRESDAIVPAQCIVSPRPRSSHMEGSSALLAHTCWVQAYHSSAAPTDEKTAGAPIRWAERRDGHRGALQHASTVSVWPVDRQHANAPAGRWCLGTLWRRRVRVGRLFGRPPHSASAERRRGVSGVARAPSTQAIPAPRPCPCLSLVHARLPAPSLPTDPDLTGLISTGPIFQRLC